MFCRAFSASLTLWLWVACVPPRVATGGASTVPDPLAGLAPRQDPALDLENERQYQLALGAYSALAPDSPERAKARRTLWTASQTRIDRWLAHNQNQEALAVFSKALGLWSYAELDGSRPPPDMELLLPTAKELHQRFARVGRSEPTILLLGVIIAADPGHADERTAQFRDIADFQDELAVAARGPLAKYGDTIAALEDALDAFPSDWVFDRLVEAYLAQQKMLATPGPGLGGSGLFDPAADKHFPRTEPVPNLVRAFAQVGRFPEVLGVLRPLAGQTFVSGIDQVEAVLKTDKRPDAWKKLVLRLFQNPPYEKNLSPALHLTEYALTLHPDSSQLALLASQRAYEANQLPLAIRYAERAQKLAPTDKEVLTWLFQAYVSDVTNDLGIERISAAHARLRHIEAFYAQLKDQLGSVPDGVWPVEDAMVSVASGYLSVGEIDTAVELLHRAQAHKPSLRALEQLGEISRKRGQYAEAAKFFAQAATIRLDDASFTHIAHARILRMQGEALAAARQPEEARRVFRNALLRWQSLIESRLGPSGGRLNERERAELSLAFGERGRLFYHLGETQHAMASFEQAVDVDNESANVYADVIAFLLTRGHYTQALDAYHRALGRESVEEYYKVYSTVWIVKFARALQLVPDPLAVRYLEELQGSQWQHDLSRYVTGKLSFAELVAKADTRGKRAEAYFYEALSSYGRSQPALAHAYLEGVIKTDMLGFFEYDMARHLIDHGLPPAR